MRRLFGFGRLHLLHGLLERIDLLVAQSAETKIINFNVAQECVVFVEVFWNVKHLFHCRILDFSDKLIFFTVVAYGEPGFPGDDDVVLSASAAFLFVFDGHFGQLVQRG